jgi:tetratricopeptide (TPR) repeat protein
LAALGNIKIRALQQEQIHQLKLLYALKDQPEQDHLAIAVSLAQTLSTYGLQVEAFDVLEVTLNQFRAAHRGRLNDSIHDLFGRYVTMLNQAEHFARAEKLVLAGRSQVETPSERDWMQQRLFEVYTGAIFKKGSVSLGSGQALYAAEIKLFVEEFASPHKNHRQRLMDLLSSFIRLSHDARLQLEGMRQFAFVDFDVLLKTETDPGFYHSHVGKLADALHDTLGAVFALEFLVDRLEREAEWVHVSSQSGWSQHAYRLGRWRTEFKAPAALEARLLKVVTNELRQDLRTRTPNNRYLYQRHQAFWSEKKAAFGAVADAVWEEDRPSGAAATYIAAYLSRGLDDYDRAIEILYDADQAGNLDDGGKEHLVDTLHHRERFEEALPYSVVLVKRAPHVLKHRVHLMRGLYKTEQSLRLAEALETTDQHFHEAGLWNESTIAQLAQSCLDNRLLEPAVAYYDEVIALHKRRHRNRGIGDGILSGYYTRLSKAHIGLMQTTQAVDAASGAIVSWGRDEDNRHAALNGLQQVLAQAPGLDRYVETVDAQVAESGLENPVLRQALGWVYIQKRKYDRAIRQLRLAVETQPNDRRTHELLLKVYDKSGEVEGGLRQLREWITFSPRQTTGEGWARS